MIARGGINWRMILSVMGKLLIIVGGLMLTGVPFSLYYGDDDIRPILISSAITIFTGATIALATRKANPNLGKREGYIIVTFSWIWMSLFGTLPYILSGAIPDFTDAFFETMSGFTTTGASILSDIESLPHGILFWRSMTHWIGGMGIIVLSLAILPILGIGGMQLFIAEVPGPVPDKLHPRITGTAKRLWAIYVILTLAESLLLLGGGMNLFDSLCHSFGTMATGGFSTRNDSIASFSPYIQYVITLFMFLAGMNFTLHYFMLHGKFSKLKVNDEFKYYLYLTLLATLFITVGLVAFNNYPLEKGFRDTLFQVVSIITTTGFVTADYLLWPGFLWFLIFILMFTGGCAGSTGGGIKAIRQLLLFKNTRVEIKRLVHPRAIVPIRLNGKAVPEEIVFNVMAFFVIYVIVFVSGTLGMSLLGLDYESSIGSVAASLGNIGPGIGSVGPVSNYALIPVGGKWLLAFLMLLGRLELFTVLILLSPSFWKK